MSNINSRLNKLEKSIAGDGYCPHQPLLVWYGDDGSGEEPREKPPPQIPGCECGGEQILLKVVYESPIRGIETQ